ncbi:hypothetical protein TNCV_2537811 [Trichonephila clavipes]|nr:hypothetical protein TNCV_2537811 [Trichonephila clavipes]
MIRNAAACYIIAMRKLLLSRVMVQRGRPHRFVVSPCIQQWHVHSTAAWFHPTRWPISAKDNPHFLRDSSVEFLNLVKRRKMAPTSVQALVPQKFSVEEELMHVKHVDVKSPHVGVMWKFGRGVISSGIVLVT